MNSLWRIPALRNLYYPGNRKFSRLSIQFISDIIAVHYNAIRIHKPFVSTNQ